MSDHDALQAADRSLSPGPLSGSITGPISRRRFLTRTSGTFRALAAGALFGGALPARALGRAVGLQDDAHPQRADPFAPRPPHFTAPAKNVIFLYMDGAPSQMDTFDHKPELERWDGKPLPIEAPATQFDDVGTVMASPWKFKPGGESGLMISDLFPAVRKHADKLCMVRSMTSKFPEHTAANYFLHTGHNPAGRPSMGAWISYGLGSEADDLPGYVVLDGGLTPPGGIECYGSGFLSPSFQGSVFRPRGEAVAHARGAHTGTSREAGRRRLLESLDRREGPIDPSVAAALANYELAFRMQAAVPELSDLSGESDATKALYCIDDKYAPKATFGRQCLLARKLVQRGVRFVQVSMVKAGPDRWDQHSNIKQGHADNARAVDEPIAALLHDLEAHGLLDSTVVLFAGEFGRTPMAQGQGNGPGRGRDHNPHGYTAWLAGGGVKGGMSHGATDDFGYHAVDSPLEMHDLHATLLHLMGLDHTHLTVRFDGRDMRLTDVFGHVVHDLIA